MNKIENLKLVLKSKRSIGIITGLLGLVAALFPDAANLIGIENATPLQVESALDNIGSALMGIGPLFGGYGVYDQPRTDAIKLNTLPPEKK